MPPRKEAADDGDNVATLSSGSDDDDGAGAAAAAHNKKKPAAAAQKKKPAPAAAAKRKPAPPAKRSQDYSYDDDDDSSETEDSESGSDDSDKAPPARGRKPPAKKKAKAGSGSASPPPAATSPGGGGGKKQHIARAEPGTEPKSREFERATGYWLDPTLPLMWTSVSAPGDVGPHVQVQAREKIAAFDLDGTLVNVKNSGPAGRTYPIDENDWVLFNDRVPAAVRRYFQEGYEIAIISNQGGVQKKLAGKMAQMIKARSASVAATLGVPCRVLLCPSRDPDNGYRKPQTGMWDFLLSELRGEDAPEVDLKASVFVGDAAGRAADHNGKGADSDRRFAEAVGFGTFLTPEEAFGAQKGKAPISAEKWKAGAAAVNAAKAGDDEAAGPNAALLAALSGVSDKIFALIKEKPACLPGDDLTKWRFKAAAYGAAAKSIAGGFSEKITLKNLSKVGKLPKVGKSTLEKLKECLEQGRIALMDELEGYEAAGSAPAAAVPAHVQQQQAAAAAFM